MKEDIRFGRIAGIPVGASWSLLVIVTLITWTLAAGVLPEGDVDYPTGVYWAVGAVTAVAFLVSLLAHEMAHALVAKANSMPVEGITLWMFGGIAQLVGAMEELNAILLNTLLAPHGSMPMQRDHFWDLPLYFDAGITPIAISVPPFHFWEPPPLEGAVPMHGSDFGLFQLAEVLGMKQVIYVKDEDGLYNKDPKKHKDAKKYGRITLEELLANPPEENILDEEMFRTWAEAKNLKRIQIVNGLVPGQLTKALDGEDVGTVITKGGAK